MFKALADVASFCMVSVDPGCDKQLVATFNPKEMQIDKTVTWQANARVNHDVPGYQFTGSQGRTISLELFFDSCETGETVEESLTTITAMSLIIDPASKDERKRRPPILKLVNGPLPELRCVIESLSIKVTMFDKHYRPTRAVATVKLKEVDIREFLEREPRPIAGRAREPHAPQRAR